MALLGSFFFGFAPMFLFAAFVNWLDRYEKEPKLLLGAAFAWGVVIAGGGERAHRLEDGRQELVQAHALRIDRRPARLGSGREHEVAERVRDQPALVELQPAQDVRAGAEHQVGLLRRGGAIRSVVVP